MSKATTISVGSRVVYWVGIAQPWMRDLVNTPYEGTVVEVINGGEAYRIMSDEGDRRRGTYHSLHSSSVDAL